MTDSMKFGPEWLRNMSADSTASGQLANSAAVNVSSGSGMSSSYNNNSNSNLSLSSSNANLNIGSSNANIPSSGASRNTFPEFRYGREEMLLLFDRNCNIPEILPSFKQLFVERVQFPLALVPSTDEEMITQGSTPPTQRPVWLQRSPIGFSTSSRGTGRGGSMERGRMRGKSVYHPVFQRPNVMFEEDQRSTAIKADRSWAERNGGAGGDVVTSGGPPVIGGLSSDTWNGNTPSSSPRREFSNHPRNMENWRRSRNEDGSGGDGSTTFSADGGWRMNSSGFQNSHSRWGRSTSWRDDDLANNNENSGVTTSGGAPFAAGGGMMMQRSYSTISTAHGERMPHQNLAKQTSGHSSAGVTGTSRSTVVSSGNRNAVLYMWPNNVQANVINTMSSNSPGDGINDEHSLPEWAMENPSDIGGTFDASGAFHGAVDNDEENDDDREYHDHHELPQNEDNGARLSDAELLENSTKPTDDHVIKFSKQIYKYSSLRESENRIDSSTPSPSPAASINNTINHENIENLGECDQLVQDNRSVLTDIERDTVNKTNSQNSTNHPEHIYSRDTSASNQNYPANSNDNDATNNNVRDYAERMMKVADDMIEKLIMDDEDAKDDQIKSSMITGGNKSNPQHVYGSVLQQQQNSNHQTVSPAMTGGAGPSAPPNISIPALYNMTGMMVDHTQNMATLHQLQQQQMAAVAAAAIGLQPPPPPPPHPLTSTAPTDLWLYRDPQSKVQGPFSALEMTEWYRAGYFNENLFVRRVCDTRYRPLGELIKICNGQMPFNHSHMIPIDLNSSHLTPPLPINLNTQPSPQPTDFVLKTLSENHHHQQQHQKHEELKDNVTAAADSLSNALKSLINSVDMSQVLNMHFQTLQERFIRNQEIEIVNDLSKNDCFQRLPVAEQDSVVRQKLQMIILPEYLTNLTGLSNSLAALNPSAGTQLYETIAEYSKKEQLFNNQQQQSQAQQQQQQRAAHNTSSTPYVNAEEFIMKAKTNDNHDLGSDDILNELSLRLFLNSGTDTDGVATPNSHVNEFLGEQQLFRATPNPSNNTSESPMMQMWMNQITSNQLNQVHPQQLMSGGQPHGVNNQWLNGPLVGIPSIGMSREQHCSGGGIMGSLKPTPTSMWDVATLEQHVQVQQQLQQQKQQQEQQQEQQQLQQLQQQNFEHNRHLEESEKTQLEQQQHQIINQQNEQQQQIDHEQELQHMQQKSNEPLKQQQITEVSLNDNKQEQQELQVQQASTEKSINQTNIKRNTVVIKPTTKPKDDIAILTVNKKIEEDRRREQNEEKRRQKEERKRQQIEDDKRRYLQAEEEKRRQVQEEEKRQQQIQAQRRKALMNSNNSNPSNNTSTATNGISGNNVGNINPKPNTKEQQRIQTSVAPWSTQTMTAKSHGPGLAEIQKAERRERRADQQRQSEMHEKHMRDLAATADAQDTTLMWNASPVQVKSFAEIQAEEAKRLAHEQMELQRRKELETNSALANFNAGIVNTPGGTNNISNNAFIWSGAKIWGTTTNTTGFWEEPLKLNKKTVNGGGNISNSSNINNSNNSNLTAATVVAQSSSFVQPKTSPQQQHYAGSSNKNIKKSRSIAVMQNTISNVGSASGMAINQKKSLQTLQAAKQIKSQKPDTSTADNKKVVATKTNTSTNKCDDYEAEFISWCTKSLNNMNTKVDVPTFVSFLRDLESPYEVKDYIRMYLGETKEYIDFAKQFLERRSKYKNLQRAQNAHNDDLCKPAQAITPSANDNNENKGKQKKVKKNKMMKLDARILGFSVTAAEGRINVGDRDYVDAP